MNEILIADIIANIIDEKKVEIEGDTYHIESYSEDEKIIVFMNAEDSDESFEYFSIIENPMV